MTNRVHIDAPAGIIDIEGEKDFVEGLLAKLFPLVEGAGFGSQVQNANPAQGIETQDLFQPEEVASEKGMKSKIKKKRSNFPPRGQSCADRILTLKKDNFFKNHRTTAEIGNGLKSKGWTHAANQISAALQNMFVRGDIQRTKEGSGSWKYFWDRD